RDAAGNVFPEGGIDPESIRYSPATRSIFWATESDVAGNPGLYQSRLDGSFLRAFAVPGHYNVTADGSAGIYSNLGFESLAILPDGTSLLTGTENALVQDGDKATLEAGSPSRLVGFDIASGQINGEWIYENGPIHAKATAEPPYNDNGLSEFMAFDETHLLTVERSFAAGLGNEISFYLTDLSSGTDVAGKETIKGETVEPLVKQPVFTIGEGDFGGIDVDNIESVTFGPEIEGKRTLVIASDNNFNANGQFTQFVVFTLDE
ncbi:MAG: esterase-like activity of phytase family protein, partial [Pseudomonadota bacterium]|nr:esterase-like activity of phytase family protein [Pseudomonadota bacterium]